MRTQRRRSHLGRRRRRGTRRGGAWYNPATWNPREWKMPRTPLADYSLVKGDVYRPYERLKPTVDEMNRIIMDENTMKAMGQAINPLSSRGAHELGNVGRFALKGAENVGKLAGVATAAGTALGVGALASPFVAGYYGSKYGAQKYGEYQQRAEKRQLEACEQMLATNGYDVYRPGIEYPIEVIAPAPRKTLRGRLSDLGSSLGSIGSRFTRKNPPTSLSSESTVSEESDDLVPKEGGTRRRRHRKHRR